ncbi:MAG: carbohydrate-binding family 9-like protein [Myxococcales bacterium]|nr:carbohydrate-binding family 9-like protein [Myxococcales bacterium]
MTAAARVGAAACVLGLACEPSPPPREEPTASAPTHAEVPSLTIPKRRGDVTIDGSLDEPAWRAAASTGAFVHAGDGKPRDDGHVQAEAWLSWDDASLYVAVRVKDRHLRGGFPQNAVDPPLWTRDCVELMIDPDGDGDGRDYYEIEIGPQNLVFDSRFDAEREPRGGPDGPFGHQDWRSEIESAVRRAGELDDDDAADEGYDVELRLPFAALAKARHRPPRPGDHWRLNLYALDEGRAVAWSPVLGAGTFHRASRFGRIRFASP